jgi:hypothetical protein
MKISVSEMKIAAGAEKNTVGTTVGTTVATVMGPAQR